MNTYIWILAWAGGTALFLWGGLWVWEKLEDDDVRG